MVKPACPKCGGTEFAATPAKIRGWNDIVTLFHCDTCGTVIGSTYMETDAMYEELTRDIKPVDYK